MAERLRPARQGGFKECVEVEWENDMAFTRRWFSLEDNLAETRLFYLAQSGHFGLFILGGGH